MSAIASRREMILKESLWKLLAKLSLPGIAGMLVIAVNSFIDALYVGRFVGAEALAGVSMVIPVMVLNTALLNLIVTGGASLLSRSIGSDDKGIQQRILAHVFILSIGVSAILMLLGIFFARPLMAITGAKGEVLQYAIIYYRISQIGCFFSVFGLASSGLIRAEGRIKMAMSISFVGVIVNAVLNPFFILVFELGVQGSAYATIVSMAIYCILTTRYFLSGKSVVTPELNSDTWRKTIFTAILSVGVSSMLMQLSSFIRQLFLFKAVTRYGSDGQIILFSAIYRLFSFSIIPVFGILQSLQPVVGINYGAGQFQRSVKAVKVFLVGCLALMITIVLPTFLFPEQALSLLIPDIAPNTSDIFNFRIVLFVLLIAPVSSVSVVFLQATGNAKWSAWLSGGRELILFIPLIFLLSLSFGYDGVYYTLLLENVLYMLIVLFVTRYNMVNMPSFDRSTNSFTLSFRFFQVFNRKVSK